MYLGIVVDESGSMAGMRASVISGFNEYVQSLKDRIDVDVQAVITKFSTTPSRVHDGPIKGAEFLSNDTYNPSGSTALYDAIGSTLKALDDKIESLKPVPSVLFVIMTDGHENASREYSKPRIKELVSEREKKGNWTFVYIGADLNAMDEAGKIGATLSNSYSYEKTLGGTQSMYDALKKSTGEYLGSVGVSHAVGKPHATANFWEEVWCKKDASCGLKDGHSGPCVLCYK
jgi:hypothetical protein